MSDAATRAVDQSHTRIHRREHAADVVTSQSALYGQDRWAVSWVLRYGLTDAEWAAACDRAEARLTRARAASERAKDQMCNARGDDGAAGETE